MQSGCTAVKQFNEGYCEWLKNRKHDSKGQFVKGDTLPDSYRSIANFLSKNGKTVSHVTVKNYIDVNDKLKKEKKRD